MLPPTRESCVLLVPNGDAARHRIVQVSRTHAAYLLPGPSAAASGFCRLYSAAKSSMSADTGPARSRPVFWNSASAARLYRLKSRSTMLCVQGLRSAATEGRHVAQHHLQQYSTAERSEIQQTEQAWAAYTLALGPAGQPALGHHRPPCSQQGTSDSPHGLAATETQGQKHFELLLAQIISRGVLDCCIAGQPP